jgi:hypothetical protein
MWTKRSEAGAALIAAVMITSLVGALAAALVFVVTIESRVGRHQQSAESGAYAAVAAVERLIGELRRWPTWQTVPSASSVAPNFNDGRILATLADGTTLDLRRLAADRQAASDAFYPAGPNRPMWMLYAHASLARVTSTGLSMSNPYVVVWVADDADDADGDPSRDANGVILVRAEAFGVRGAWRAIEATLSAAIARDDAGVAVGSRVTVIAWREAR